MKGRVNFASPIVLGRQVVSYFGGIMALWGFRFFLEDFWVCFGGGGLARRGRFPERLAGKEALGIV